MTDPDSAASAARRVLELGTKAVLASLGAQGAVLVTQEGSWRTAAPEIEVDSVVGASDSLLAGVLVALAEGKPWEKALRLGVTCGTVTATAPGTEVCTKEMVEALLPRITVEKL